VAADERERARLRKMLEDLKALDEDDPSLARRIAEILVGEPSPQFSHQGVQELLPEYLEARLIGAPLTAEHRWVQRHLNRCLECSAIYTMMLEHENSLSIAPLGEPTREAERPAPVTMRTFITALVGDLLRALHPAELPYLPSLAKAFFEDLSDLPAGPQLRPTLAARFGQAGKGAVEPPLVTRYLAATLTATRELRERLGADELTTGKAWQDLEALARQAAMRAAREMRLDRQEVDRFANEFARLVQSLDLRNLSSED
jgi:hypothetical protein